MTAEVIPLQQSEGAGEKPAPRSRKVKLTDAMLRAIKPDGREFYIGDTEATGLRVRVTPAGKLIFQAQFRPRGASQPKKLRLGEYPTTRLADARKEARRIRTAVDEGRDPAAERKAEQRRRQIDHDRSFASLVERWRELHAPRLSPKTAADYERLISGYLMRAWRKKPVVHIDRSAIQEVVDPLRRRGAHGQARLVFATASSLLSFAVESGRVERNPAKDMTAPRPPAARDRILSDREVRWLWQATATLGFPFGPAFRVLLLTAARRQEVAGMTPRELDLQQAVWTIPATRAKNDREHQLDLHPLALAELRALDLGRDFVFGRTNPASGWSQAKKRLDKRIAELAADAALDAPAPWRIHDLRRTAASGMARLGFQPIVVEKVLNHQSGAAGGLVAVYQHHDRREERRQAITAWGDHVARLTQPS